MYIEFKSTKLKRQCEQVEEGTRAWGRQIAHKVIRRINALKAADSIYDLSPLPPVRCHALKGPRQGQYAIDVGERHRLVFGLMEAPVTTSEEEGTSPEHMVKILEVVDYHGK